MATDRIEIPEHMEESLIRYIEHRVQPGGFLIAVIKGDLFTAVGCADEQNLPLIPRYAQWLLRNAPEECYGSSHAFSNWLRRPL